MSNEHRVQKLFEKLTEPETVQSDSLKMGVYKQVNTANEENYKNKWKTFQLYSTVKLSEFMKKLDPTDKSTVEYFKYFLNELHQTSHKDPFRKLIIKYVQTTISTGLVNLSIDLIAWTISVQLQKQPKLRLW